MGFCEYYCAPCTNCVYSVFDSIRHLKVHKFCCCIDLKRGVYIIAAFFVLAELFPAYSVISRASLAKVVFYSGVTAIRILATIFLLIGTRTKTPKFISVWLALTTFVWLVYPFIAVIFMIWLHEQPRTHFQERTIRAEILTLAVITILKFILTPYFLVVAKSYRSELLKEKQRLNGRFV